MPDIFLSYSRKDIAIAGKVSAALQAAGHDVWWDQSLKAGEVYDQVTEAALREARLVVVLWSKAAVASDWVRSEATVALQRGALVPVMIEECQRPVMFELRQSADLIGWKGNAKDPRLLALVDEVTRQLGAEPAPAATAAPASGPNRRILIGGGAALGVAALAGSGWWLMRPRPAAAADTSIAVLPFANLSGDPAQVYFSDGIAEELRSALATIAGLKVAARTSSELMRDTDIKEAAGKLGVASILTGSVRRGDGKVRVTSQLLDGATGLERWSQTFDRPAGDVLEVQTGIAQSVAAALSVQFGKAAAMVGGTRNPVAFDAYLRGQAPDSGNESQLREALAAYDLALAADPNFAAAHANRAIRLLRLVAIFDVEQPAEAKRMLTQAEAGAIRAATIAPSLPIAHTALALVRRRRLDLRGADAASKEALRLSGLVSEDLRLAADFQSQMGRGTLALSLIDRAIGLDPLNPVVRRTRIILLMDARRAGEALAAMDAWPTVSKGDSISPRTRTRALLLAGRAKDALAEASKIERPWLRFYTTALAQSMLGNRQASNAALAALRADSGPLAAYQIASVYAVQGETDLAFAELDVAARTGDPGLLDLRVDHTLDSLRDDPRYAALEKRLGFPPR